MDKIYRLICLLVGLTLLLLSPATSKAAIRGINDLEGTIDCGGAGTFVRIKGPNCLKVPCKLEPGVQYDLEIEYIISQATTSQTLKMFILLTPITIPIVDVVIPDSAADAGTQVLLHYPIVPNSELQGQEFVIRGEVFSDGDTLEMCRLVDCFMDP